MKRGILIFKKHIYLSILIFSFIFSIVMFFEPEEALCQIKKDFFAIVVGIMTLDAILSSFINVEKWRTKRNYTEEQNAFLFLKFSNCIILFSSILLLYLPAFDSKSIYLIIFLGVSCAFVFCNVMYSFSLLLGVLLSII